MRLFHGTNSLRWSEIKTSGCLRGPVYLTDSLQVARYFAKWHAGSSGADIVLLTLEVDERHLCVDEMSLLDPIPLARQTMGITDVDSYLEELANCPGESWFHELAHKHAICYQHPWEVSLRLAHAVKHDLSITLDHVMKISHEQKKFFEQSMAPG